MRNLFGENIPAPAPDTDDRKARGEKRDRQPDPNGLRKVGCDRTKGAYFARSVKSELNLEETLPWHFEKGAAYHCFSFGDVDSLTYLRAIVKQQPVEYCLISTWCMAITDVKEVEKWLEAGYIKRVDWYVGEIFQASYADVYIYLLGVCRKHGGRVCVFRNHSKVMAGFGRDFDFTIESSANVNTNPRSEQAVITVSTQLARFYKEEIFDEIQAFNQDFKTWQPYKLQRDETV